MKKRPAISRAVTEAVMKEFRHLCAICGRHNPHLHHLDSDPTNNVQENLLPLCPNCHLQDVHDPTGAPDQRKLKIFRRYKDPLILDPRFHPLFLRTLFVRDYEMRRMRPKHFNYLANELLDFVQELEMGPFYRKKILNLMKFPFSHYAVYLTQGGKQTTRDQVSKDALLITAAYQHCAEAIEGLSVELLRYQTWNQQKPSDQRHE